MRRPFPLLSLFLFLIVAQSGLHAQPPSGEEEAEAVDQVVDFQSEVVGTWLETYTVVEGDTSSVINLEGKETYWFFNPDGSFKTAARWAFTKTDLMTFGEYTYSFEENKLFWDGEASGWEVIEVRDDMLIMPARFIGDKQGTSVWMKVEEIEIEK